MTRFRHDKLTDFVERVLGALGVPPGHARTTADCLVAANLRGVDSHGVRLLPIYARRLELGVMNPRPRIRAIAEGAAFATLDADNGLGPVAGAQAMDRAIGIARKAGLAGVAVRNSNHFGAAAWYAERAAAAGMIGLATSNGTPALAPWGGRSPFFGANPLAVAVPAGNEPPIVFDMATSVSSRARIRQRAARGEAIPADWAIDSDGRPTTDAAAAIAGALLPLGGAKGYGLALVLEVLAGVLAGAGLSPENGDLYNDLDRPQGLGHFFLAIDPAAFLSDWDLHGRVDSLVRGLRATPPAEGHERVRIPGEASAARREERLVHGIPLPADQATELAALGERYGVPFPSTDVQVGEGEQRP